MDKLVHGPLYVFCQKAFSLYCIYRSTGRNNGVKQYGNIYALIKSGLRFGHMMTSMK